MPGINFSQNQIDLSKFCEKKPCWSFSGHVTEKFTTETFNFTTEICFQVNKKISAVVTASTIFLLVAPWLKPRRLTIYIEAMLSIRADYIRPSYAC